MCANEKKCFDIEEQSWIAVSDAIFRMRLDRPLNLFTSRDGIAELMRSAFLHFDDSNLKSAPLLPSESPTQGVARSGGPSSGSGQRHQHRWSGIASRRSLPPSAAVRVLRAFWCRCWSLPLEQKVRLPQFFLPDAPWMAPIFDVPFSAFSQNSAYLPNGCLSGNRHLLQKASMARQKVTSLTLYAIPIVINKGYNYSW